MNGKQRVQAVLDGRSTDRVPLGFYAVDCDTVEKVLGHKTYVRNKAGQWLAYAEGRRDEVVESLKADTVEFFRKVDLADVVLPKECPIVPPRNYEPCPVRRIDDLTWEDAQGRVWRLSTLTNEMAVLHDPTAQAKEWTVDDFPAEPELPAPDPSEFEVLDHVIAELGEERFVCGYGRLGAQPKPGGMDRGLMLYVLNPEIIEAAVRHSIAVGNALDEYYVRPGQSGVLLDEDYGTTRAPMISPAMFREFTFPGLKARCEHLAAKGQPTILHSCGNTWPLIEMFIAAGVRCYQSLQTDAGLDIAKLQAEFGGRLVFWGGVAIEKIVSGSTEDVRAETRRAAEIGRGGSIIVGPSHSIAYGVPYDNFMALLDEFDKTATIG